VIISKLFVHMHVLRRGGGGRLLPSDSTPSLQYGSGPSCDFLAKILDVEHSTVFSTQFYFSRFLSLLKGGLLSSTSKAQLVACLYMVRATRV
jgi:hypothetical protein